MRCCHTASESVLFGRVRAVLCLLAPLLLLTLADLLKVLLRLIGQTRGFTEDRIAAAVELGTVLFLHEHPQDFVRSISCRSSSHLELLSRWQVGGLPPLAFEHTRRVAFTHPVLKLSARRGHVESQPGVRVDHL